MLDGSGTQAIQSYDFFSFPGKMIATTFDKSSKSDFKSIVHYPLNCGSISMTHDLGELYGIYTICIEIASRIDFVLSLSYRVTITYIWYRDSGVTSLQYSCSHIWKDIVGYMDRINKP